MDPIMEDWFSMPIQSYLRDLLITTKGSRSPPSSKRFVSCKRSTPIRFFIKPMSNSTNFGSCIMILCILDHSSHTHRCVYLLPLSVESDRRSLLRMIGRRHFDFSLIKHMLRKANLQKSRQER